MIRIIFFLALTLLIQNRALAFGELGHRVIASLAFSYLTPQAKIQIQKILALESSSRSLNNTNKSGVTDSLKNTFVDISIWADKIRFYQKETGPWHYVNWEVGDTLYNESQLEKPNIISALKEQINVLKNPKVMAQEKKVALMWVVHLLGDLHQPLHMGEDHDRGGNDQKVKVNRRTFNLHAVWDHVLLDKLNLDEDEMVMKLLTELAQDKTFVTRNMRGTVEDWAKESHRKAKSCYVLRWKGNHESEEKIPKGIKVSLEKPYTEAGTRVSAEQLKLGGIRLAALLNQIFSIR